MRTRQILLVALLGLYNVGCTSWRQASPATAGQVPAGQPMHVRLQMTDGSTVELERAVVRGDSLIGEVPGPARPIADARAAVALADIRAIERRQFSGARTAGLVGAVAAGSFVLFHAVFALLYSWYPPAT